MTTLTQLKRLLAMTGTLLFAVCVLIPAPSPAVASVSRPGLSLSWTPALAREFPGCQERVPGVAAAFVVERLDGTVERMGFDAAWHRTHDRQGADDVWTLAQCAA